MVEPSAPRKRRAQVPACRKAGRLFPLERHVRAPRALRRGRNTSRSLPLAWFFSFSSARFFSSRRFWFSISQSLLKQVRERALIQAHFSHCSRHSPTRSIGSAQRGPRRAHLYGLGPVGTGGGAGSATGEGS